MHTRREFVQLGVAVAAFAPVASAGQSSPEVNPGPKEIYKLIFDERFPQSVEAAREAAGAGVPVHAIRGDITSLWYDDLYFAWKKGPTVIAGVTGADSLFCLDLLARDAGMRVKSRRDEGELVYWVIGPKAWRPAASSERTT